MEGSTPDWAETEDYATLEEVFSARYFRAAPAGGRSCRSPRRSRQRGCGDRPRAQPHHRLVGCRCRRPLGRGGRRDRRHGSDGSPGAEHAGDGSHPRAGFPHRAAHDPGPHGRRGGRKLREPVLHRQRGHPAHRGLPVGRGFSPGRERDGRQWRSPAGRPCSHRDAHGHHGRPRTHHRRGTDDHDDDHDHDHADHHDDEADHTDNTDHHDDEADHHDHHSEHARRGRDAGERTGQRRGERTRATAGVTDRARAAAPDRATAGVPDRATAAAAYRGTASAATAVTRAMGGAAGWWVRQQFADSRRHTAMHPSPPGVRPGALPLSAPRHRYPGPHERGASSAAGKYAGAGPTEGRRERGQP